MDALAWAEGADGGGDYVVRQSDADSLGHINNARWAHILYDARLHAIDAERQEGRRASYKIWAQRALLMWPKESASDWRTT